MKKLLSMILAVMLSCLFVFGAFAEDLSEGDVATKLPDATQVHFEKRDLESYSMASKDVVTIDGNNYTVQAGDLKYELKLDPSLGYIVLTQDYAASLEDYWIYTDSEGMWNLIVENDFHFFFDNLYTGTIAYLVNLEADDFSRKIGNLQGLSDDILEAYLAIFLRATGIEKGEIVTCGSTPWMRLMDSVYITFVNGEYVAVYWEGENAMTDDDAADMQDLLSGLTISVA